MAHGIPDHPFATLTVSVPEERRPMASDETLKMYRNDSDWVIATSPEDATAVLVAQMGDGYADDMGDEWRELPMDKVTKLWMDPDGTVSAPDEDGAMLVEMTVAEEIAKFGRGYVGSEDY